MSEKAPHLSVTRRPVILWFRSDLRLQDHAGVAEALASGAPILPVFILDDSLATRPLGPASRWWLYRSLKVLVEELEKFKSRLIVRRGDAAHILQDISKEIDVETIICSHTFDPKTEELDDRLENSLGRAGINMSRHNTSLLTLPNLIQTGDNKPFRVFTPFFKVLMASDFAHVQTMPPHPTHAWPAPAKWPTSLNIDDLDLGRTRTPSGVDWAAGFDRFTPGERGARKALRRFLAHGLVDYAEGRDRTDKDVTSHLSPHLRFGEISPQRVLFEVDRAVAEAPGLAAPAAKFRAELAWREFCHGLLDQQPSLHAVNFRDGFDRFPWRDDDKGFRAWCRGETGYELVDAGMRELWQTGYMHNRVRMVCASFLVKHLLIDWRRGEQWFWDCLLDADPANNPANWQWVAGCGADAAPYFRIFNPMTQADKFDPAGLYRARYITGHQPDIHNKRPRDLFDMTATSDDYPQPIIDHAFARERALEAYKHRNAA